MDEGLGAKLTERSSVVCEIVREHNRLQSQERGRMSEVCDASSYSIHDRPRLPMSVKIRIVDGDDPTYFRKTCDLAMQIEHAGADWLDLHGRTWRMKSASTDVITQAVRTVKQHALKDIPVVHNGDVFSMDDAWRIYNSTDCCLDGVMSARGLLKNPSLFGCSNAFRTNISLDTSDVDGSGGGGGLATAVANVYRFLDLTTRFGTDVLQFRLAHNHVCFLLNDHLSRNDMLELQQNCCSFSSIVDFLETRGLFACADENNEEVEMSSCREEQQPSPWPSSIWHTDDRLRRFLQCKLKEEA